MKNVFVIGLDDFHRPLLEALPVAAECRFHRLLERSALRDPENIPFSALLDLARAELDEFDGSVDAICGYWDFPTSCLVPLLCRERGLPAVSLEGTLRCEHKYWSRRLQHEVIAELVPPFEAVDPFDEDAAARISLSYPFWLKPVKSFNSYLGFRIENEDDLTHALREIRAKIHTLGEPFAKVLEKANLPPEIAAVDGFHCIAEGMVHGDRQCTVEGWVLDGEIQIHGVVDSIRHSGRSTFARYQYPSTLDEGTVDTLADISKRVIRHLDCDGTHFNIEYFRDDDSGALSLLEVNPRISQSHSEIFAKVDGQANHSVMVDLALGRRPEFPHGRGEFACAAKFFERSFEDAVVRRAPDRARIEGIERRFPGTRIEILVHPDLRLSELGHQETYSYELAWVYLGADSEADLLAKHEEIAALLDFDLAPVDGG